MTNEQITGMQKFQARVLELAQGDTEKAELSSKLAELELDFEFVKNLNTELATKYQQLMDTFPTVKELDSMLRIIEDDLKQTAYIEEEKVLSERLGKLTRFRSALVALERNDPLAKPVKYDELFKDENKS